MATNHRVRGFAIYLIAAGLFGINGSVAKSLLDIGISSMRLSQFRVSFAFLVLLIVVLLTNRKALKIRSKHEFALLAAYGWLGVTLTQWLYFVAIHLLPVGVALVIEFTAPLMVAVWVKFAWSHHVPNLAWVGLAVALAGLVMVTEVWDGFTLDALGVVSAAGAAAALAVYYLAGEKALHSETPRDPVSLTMWGFGLASLFWAVVQPWWSFPWSALTGTMEFLPGADPLPKLALAAWMVVMGTVIPFWLVLAAMRYISAQQASAAGMTEPVLASLVAWLVLGEVLSGWQIIGGAVTLAGIGIAEFARR